MSETPDSSDQFSSSAAHGHVPVMVDEVLEHLSPQPGATVLDATLGRGGHGEVIIPRLSPGGRYVGLDLDAANVAHARDRLGPAAERAGVELTLRQANFQDARAVLDELGIDRVTGLLADLGFASAQVDDPARGFSFGGRHDKAAGGKQTGQHETTEPAAGETGETDAGDAPLDMRLDTSQALTAATLVNELPERELADVIYHCGEEPFSRRIARKIVEARQRMPIQTTRELSELVRQAYGPRARRSRMHPATRTFMALRIAVNGELEALDRLLEALPDLLTEGGCAVFISFHSLEDRRVKRALLRHAQADRAQRLTRKPLTPSENERQRNPRSRSAKLRAIEWLGAANDE